MKTEIAISVKNVSKNFSLNHLKANSIKGLVTGGYKRGGVTKTTETQHALRNISFDVKKGEFFGIVGRNGSGKSTLLKILAGIYQPTEGSVSVTGKLVPFIELGVGFNGELTGRENVYLNGAMLGFSVHELDAMYDDIVKFAELERFMDQKLKNYSSGMQVRLAFSMATRADADILLVDEVLAVGDADFQRKCFEYFRSLKKQKKTVVFVSHDLSAVREYCDRAILINENERVTTGTSGDVAAAYTKLFTPADSQGTSEARDAKSKRWGDQGVVQTSARLKPGTSINETVTNITLEVSFTAKVAAHGPIFGFLIKNTAGAQLMGINSKLKRIDAGSYGAGESGVMEWEIPNVFNEGNYLIDVAISHSDGITQYDWWEDAVSFTVTKDEKTPYIIAPPVTARVAKRA